MMTKVTSNMSDMPGKCPIIEFRNAVFHTGRNLTVRRGHRWHGVSQARLDLGQGVLSAPVALQTQVRRFDTLQVTDLQCEHDAGCRTPAGLLAELRRIHPEFSAGDEVTLVYFEFG